MTGKMGFRFFNVLRSARYSKSLKVFESSRTHSCLPNPCHVQSPAKLDFVHDNDSPMWAACGSTQVASGFSNISLTSRPLKSRQPTLPVLLPSRKRQPLRKEK